MAAICTAKYWKGDDTLIKMRKMSTRYLAFPVSLLDVLNLKFQWAVPAEVI